MTRGRWLSAGPALAIVAVPGEQFYPLSLNSRYINFNVTSIFIDHALRLTYP
jgi:hypothetical protein